MILFLKMPFDHAKVICRDEVVGCILTIVSGCPRAAADGYKNHAASTRIKEYNTGTRLMSRISIRLASVAALSLATVCFAVPAFAGDIDDKIEAREKTMKAMGAGMKAASDFVKGDKDLDDLKKAAAGLAAAAAKNPADVFPKGTQAGVGDSKAKPELWAEWSKAEGYWAALAPGAAKLIVAAEAGDKAAVGAAAQALGASCKSCHEAYRIKKD